MRRILSLCIAAMLIAALPQAASAQKRPGTIMIVNQSGYCLWATVYYAGHIVGRPGWTPVGRGYYDVPWKGVGQRWELRTEILSTRDCKAQNAQNPLKADISVGMQGSLAYEVIVERQGSGFRLVRV